MGVNGLWGPGGNINVNITSTKSTVISVFVSLWHCIKAKTRKPCLPINLRSQGRTWFFFCRCDRKVVSAFKSIGQNERLMYGTNDSCTGEQHFSQGVLWSSERAGFLSLAYLVRLLSDTVNSQGSYLQKEVASDRMDWNRLLMNLQPSRPTAPNIQSQK